MFGSVPIDDYVDTFGRTLTSKQHPDVMQKSRIIPPGIRQNFLAVASRVEIPVGYVRNWYDGPAMKMPS